MPTLNDIPLGTSATIDRIEGTDAIAMRLMEMGFLDGETVKFIGTAPLGDPLEFDVSGSQISLRKSEAVRVYVTLPPSA